LVKEDVECQGLGEQEWIQLQESCPADEAQAPQSGESEPQSGLVDITLIVHFPEM